MSPTFVHKSCQQPRIPTTQRWFEIIPTDPTWSGVGTQIGTGEQKIHVSKVRKLKNSKTQHLNFIKHPKLSKNSTWAESYMNLTKTEKWPFFLSEIVRFRVDLRSDNDIYPYTLDIMVIRHCGTLVINNRFLLTAVKLRYGFWPQNPPLWLHNRPRDPYIIRKHTCWSFV